MAKIAGGLWDGYWESKQSWRELLLDLKQRGKGIPLAVGGCALGFRKALFQASHLTMVFRLFLNAPKNGAAWMGQAAGRGDIGNKIRGRTREKAKGHLKPNTIFGISTRQTPRLCIALTTFAMWGG